MESKLKHSLSIKLSSSPRKDKIIQAKIIKVKFSKRGLNSTLKKSGRGALHANMQQNPSEASGRSGWTWGAALLGAAVQCCVDGVSVCPPIIHVPKLASWCRDVKDNGTFKKMGLSGL